MRPNETTGVAAERVELGRDYDVADLIGLAVDSGRPGPTVAIVAGIHGDEHDGPQAVLDLLDQARPVRGRLLCVPVAHAEAFAAGSRNSPLDGLDLNREFPGSTSGSPSQRLAAALLAAVVAPADVLITCHGWSTGYLTLPYTEYPAAAKTAGASRALAVATGHGYVEPLPDRPGRLMATAARLGKVAVEMEIGGEGITLPQRRADCLRSLVSALAHLAMWGGDVPPPARSTDIERTSVLSPQRGVLRTHVELGENVVAGQLLARIVDLGGSHLAELDAPTDGRVGTLRHAGNIGVGDLVAAMFRERPPTDHPQESK